LSIYCPFVLKLVIVHHHRKHHHWQPGFS
jgi:hypothetical protein